MSWLDRLKGKSDPGVGDRPSPGIEGAEYLYHESCRVEREAGEWRGEYPGPEVSEIQMGFESCVRADTGTRLLPWWSNSTAADVDRIGRRIAFSVVHGPIPPSRQQNRYDDDAPSLGSLPDMVELDTRGDVHCFSFSPDGSTIAAVEYKSGGNVVLLDPASGTRRFLSSFDKFAGSELPLWSPDGAWLIFSTWPQPTLVSVEDGRKALLPTEASVDWWPIRGGSILFALHGKGGSQRIGSYDLASLQFEDIGPVQVPDTPGLSDLRKRIAMPHMSPTGDRVLVGSYFGPSAQYQETHASRDRVALLDPATGELDHGHSPFVDAHDWVEREHKRWRWIRSTSTVTAGTVVAGELSSRLEPPGEDRFAGESPAKFESVFVWSWQSIT